METRDRAVQLGNVRTVPAVRKSVWFSAGSMYTGLFQMQFPTVRPRPY